MRSATFALVVLIAGPATAQVVPYPGQPYIGDPIADRFQNHLEQQRRQSDAIANYSAQYRTSARLTQLELQTQRQPEPYIRLEPPLSASPEAQRLAREQATARRETTVAGVTQIDRWLDRSPR